MQDLIRSCHAFSVMGLERRVSNDHPELIGELWRDFHQGGGKEQIPERTGDAVYAVYFDYEGDHLKPYSLLVGCEVAVGERPRGSLSLRELPAARYAVFDASGPQPESLVATWRRIWSEPIERAYAWDFDRYLPSGLVEVFVGVR